MIKKLFTLYKLGRKLAKSDVLNIVSKFKKPPLAITILFQILSFSFSSSGKNNLNENEGEKLSKSLQSMGTTFIKLGQFLVTRPDIIGEELAKQLEGLQDRLPPFSLTEAKAIIKKDLGDETFNSIIDLSEPVAAASIAQVHKAKIDDNGTIKDVAIKILRPDIKKTFNEEIDALMLFAFIIESFIKKTKRLKLMEVVFLLKEITNLEMDLRFEAAAANEYAEKLANYMFEQGYEDFDIEMGHEDSYVDEETYDDDDEFYEAYGVLHYNDDDDPMDEAEYQGRKVKLGKPMQGDVKKFKVYVKNEKGNVVKVNFGHGGSSAKAAGEETMRIKKDNPDRRAAFRARHNCDSPGPRTGARYWSCKAW